MPLTCCIAKFNITESFRQTLYAAAGRAAMQPHVSLCLQQQQALQAAGLHLQEPSTAATMASSRAGTRLDNTATPSPPERLLSMCSDSAAPSASKSALNVLPARERKSV